MLGIVITILVIVVLHTSMSLYLHIWGIAELTRAISRQDDRNRKRADRAVADDDEEFIGQLVDDLRNGESSLNQGDAAAVVQTLLERHPDAKLPQEL